MSARVFNHLADQMNEALKGTGFLGRGNPSLSGFIKGFELLVEGSNLVFIIAEFNDWMRQQGYYSAEGTIFDLNKGRRR